MDTNTLGKIMAFLCSVPPDSHLRLMLQLALAVSIPDDKHEKLLFSIKGDKDLVDLLAKENLLASLIEADGNLEEAEENMLLEAMEKLGLVVPLKMQMVDALLEELSQNLVDEIREIQSSGSVSGKPLVW
ncbi:MAG: hypothetical protein AB4426_11630 [Xenococcaceae cyanobacterium]